jgi:hypothetical protein
MWLEDWPGVALESWRHLVSRPKQVFLDGRVEGNTRGTIRNPVRDICRRAGGHEGRRAGGWASGLVFLVESRTTMEADKLAGTWKLRGGREAAGRWPTWRREILYYVKRVGNASSRCGVEPRGFTARTGLPNLLAGG